MEKIELGTADGATENIEKIAELFPQVMTETKNAEGELERVVDFDALRDLLGDVTEGQRERYQFTWPGKREAKAEARRPINKTLIPEPDKSKNWDTTENLYIEGDNLDALKILKETYAGKVKLIYIDPPYNTGHDFVYDDDFAQTRGEYDSESGDYDEEGGRLVANTEGNGRFHSDWCSMMCPRLILARDLLRSDGVIAVSIGDTELRNVLNLCDEIFGNKNHVATLVWKSRAKPSNTGEAKVKPQNDAEYVVCYSGGGKPSYQLVLSGEERSYPHHDKDGNYRLQTILKSNRGESERSTMRFSLGDYTPPRDKRWQAGEETIKALFANNRITFQTGEPMLKYYEHEENAEYAPFYCFVDREQSGTAEGGKKTLNKLVGSWHGFDTVKPIQLMEYLLEHLTEENDIVLDFFSGSGTTAHALFDLNERQGKERHFILVQYPEKYSSESEAAKSGFDTVCTLGKKRIAAVGSEIKRRIYELNEQLELGAEPKPYPDLGFRVLRIDSSNFKDFYLTPGETAQESLFDFADNVKEGRTDLDLLFEVLPKLGIPYSAKIEECVLAGKKVFFVDGDKLAACFDANVGSDTIEEMAKAKPWYAVIRDSSMADDATHANYEELFRTYSPDTVPQVI